ncbi:Cytochrome bd-type quinol oxidase, subunit 1 [Hahella chejuensis KCTC 2396]|uniref:Cytochrome bd-type quinol oxidase, subunit 1 n=1 Tax=Hahella chejuensis (strain KCTC 2396) TaxID=349521 RepID=Q2SP32_HAHCH|nr:cytochrome ubiquinol oxidase subunit I [Hahella chejuensis]ABC27592.1 Cytochrome bd-type quinol oxidase, subunit 1 [Hahella chejuensis KCTC 2396]
MPDPALLSRFQFAFTISYHIIFPTITIGLSLYLALMEGLWLKTRRQVYLQQARFWQKPFAITFGMGVVSGVVLSYEFGTNFSRFSEIVGPVLSPLLTYEVLTAFFLEAGFLGIMLFGWKKVSPRVHFMATCVVCVGTMISAFWILAANSWMHTPAGYEIVDGVFHPTDWWAVIFNPSFPYRLTHMLLASFLSASLLFAGVNAIYLLRKQHTEFAKSGFSISMWAILVLAPLQILAGDMHGLNVHEHQPVKVAAMEAVWETEQGAGFRLFALPNQKEAKNDFEIVIPKAASLILTHDINGEIAGLDQVAPENRPPVAVVFFSFRIMLALGGLMLLLGVLGFWARRKGRLFDHRLLLNFSRLMIPAGVIATLAGWYVVEVGRQPWLVQGLVRTMDVTSPLPASQVMSTLILFVAVYSLLFGVYLYFMRKLIRQGPPDVTGAAQDEDLPTTLNPAH